MENNTDGETDPQSGPHDSEDDEEKSPEECLLYSARNGDATMVIKILEQKKSGEVEVDLNCRGENKANLGWTPLHLASYFGHTSVVSYLLENGATVNVQNDSGDTPLHRAAFTGRLDVVMLLLKYNADVSVENVEGYSPKKLAKTKDIHDLIEAAETCEMKKKEAEFLRHAANGDSEKLLLMLKGLNPPSINCSDKYGNTALHWSAYRTRKQVAIVLLQNGIDTKLRNNKGQLASDLTRDNQMKQILEVKPIKELQKSVDRYEGPLQKKGRIRGWKPFWVVVDRGVVSLFRTRADATTGSNRKGCKYLDQARIESHSDENHVFTLHYVDGSKQTYAVELNASCVINRQKWENAISNHIAFASNLVLMGGHISDDDEEELGDLMPLGSMLDILQHAEAHQQHTEKQITAVGNAIRAFTDTNNISNPELTLLDIQQQLNTVVSSSDELVGSLRHCLDVLTQQEQLRKVQLQQEQERSRILQESLHVLAEEHRDLEQSVGRSLGSPLPAMVDSENSDDEFFECNSSVMQNGADSSGLEAVSRFNSRCRLPAEALSKNDFSVWTFLKQCIGKELSKITMPVIFNEPLSFLQRLAECMEYSELIKKAAESNDPIERMEFIMAFAVSSKAANWDRIGKPFNPLLGETYELNREDLGFRLISEQVSHHPPVSAYYFEGPHFTLQGSVHPKLKFWGKSVEAIPKGTCTLTLVEHDEVYTWENPVCCIHNIIVGKLWIEHYGTVEVINHKTGHKAVLSFKPAGWFGKDLHKLEGYIYDNKRKKQRALCGKWTEALYSESVQEYEKWREFAIKNDTGNDPKVQNQNQCKLNLKEEKELWVVEHRPLNAHKYYNFTHFSLMLNDSNSELEKEIAPTDARLRPDIRRLEEGNLDAASEEKHRLEEKQRDARRTRKEEKTSWKPVWFSWEKNPVTNKEDWMYQGEYWNKDWSKCPHIF